MALTRQSWHKGTEAKVWHRLNNQRHSNAAREFDCDEAQAIPESGTESVGSPARLGTANPGLPAAHDALRISSEDNRAVRRHTLVRGPVCGDWDGGRTRLALSLTRICVSEG